MGCCASLPLLRSSPAHPRRHSPYANPSTSSPTTGPLADTSSSRANLHGNSPTAPGLASSSLASPRASHASHAAVAPEIQKVEDARPNRRLVAPGKDRRAKRPKTMRSNLARSLSASPSVQSGLSTSISSGSAGAKSSSAPWTTAQLTAERTAFWETQVTGRAENWGVVRMVAGLVTQGQLDEAQGVLDAAALTCPTGRLWEGVFDEWGGAYQVPEWVVVMPEGVVEGDVGDVGVDGGGLGQSLGEEKGKEKAVEVEVGVVKRVRARLSDGRPDVIVKMGSSEKVGVLIDRICAVMEFSGPEQLKIAYLGRMLVPSQSLAQQGWHEGHVVNALVFHP